MSAIKVAVATVGSSILGGISSRNASKRAAEAAKDSSAAQLALTREMAEKSRGAINNFIPQATNARNQGLQNQANFLSSALPATTDFMQQGNMNAQNTISGSMPQIQNAIMGGPVDYGFMAPQQIDYQQQMQDVLAGMPSIYQEPKQTVDVNAVMGPVNNMPTNPFNNPTPVNLDAQPNPFMPPQRQAFGRTTQNQQYFQGAGTQPAYSNDFSGGTGGTGGRPSFNMPRLNLR